MTDNVAGISIGLSIWAGIVGLLYTWGILIAAWFWHWRSPTQGKFLFMIGLGLSLAVGLLFSMPSFSSMFAGLGGVGEPLLSLVRDILMLAGRLLALYGLAVIVLRETNKPVGGAAER
jgi:hypothetical protein